ncbi:hypothetical protein OIU84_001299 [Salix udensis]|uniref:BOI-related E3 ubiquitin-protein ligase 2 n=1 Tax=Salix udensis TaxID=889485 RepID=A0AAD6P5W7_9ROSI|nr:hypothetical protein OIU84_001299 [Salix udensis]
MNQCLKHSCHSINLLSVVTRFLLKLLIKMIVGLLTMFLLSLPQERGLEIQSMTTLMLFMPLRRPKSALCLLLSIKKLIFQIQQQQSETDRLIAEHNQKVRMELEDRRKRQSRMLVSAIQEGMVKKLKEKDEEIQRMGKLNWVLQEKVKSLYLETQIWRDLAQANEATANSLRSNLEQVLAHVSEDRYVNGGRATVEDDAESSCGSSDYGRCPLAGGRRGCGEG